MGKETEQLREINSLITEIRSEQEKHFSNVNKLQERLDDIETKMARPPIDISGAANPFFEAQDKSKAFQSRECKAYNRYLRRGKEFMIAEEAKALRVADDPRAGYLAPPELDTAIIKGISEFSAVRSVAGVRQISAESLEIPKKTGTGNAYWIGEIAERTEVTGLEFGMEKIPTEEMAYLMKASLKNLEDARWPLEQEITAEMSEAFARLEGTAFLKGDGVNKPEGILTHPGIATHNSEDADDITPDSVLALPFQVKSGYISNGRYLLNRTSLWKIRAFKDPVTGTYLWQPAMGFGADAYPATICGFPYTLCPDLDDPGEDKYPILFGDFMRGYRIVDRVPFSIQRLSEKYAEFGQVGFLGRRRIGGQVVLAEAIIKLKCAVTA